MTTDCFFGTSEVDITPSESFPLCGYSWMSKRGEIGLDRLKIKVLYLKSGEEEIALCFADLHSGSLGILDAAQYYLKDKFSLGRIILAGNHTHSSVGMYHRNDLFDLILQQPRLNDVLRGKMIAGGLGLALARGVLAAKRNPKPGRLCLEEAKCWGVAWNRSVSRFWTRAHRKEWAAKHGTSGTSEIAQDLIDPRVRLLVVASDDKKDMAIFGTFGCHATALGPRQRYYSRDWPGLAEDKAKRLIEKNFGAVNVRVALGVGALGDASPLPDPEGSGGPDDQGPKLADRFSDAVAESIAVAVRPPASSQYRKFKLAVHSDLWSSKNAWEIGGPALGGAEDGPSPLRTVYREGAWKSPFPSGSAHAPKYKPIPGGWLHKVLKSKFVDIRPSKYMPVARVDFRSLEKGEEESVETFSIVTVPGEPTAWTGGEIESRLESSLGVQKIWTVGCTGEYSGYYTSVGEYRQQHYEGAMSIWGRDSLRELIDKLIALSGVKIAGIKLRPTIMERIRRAFEEIRDKLSKACAIVFRTAENSGHALWMEHASLGEMKRRQVFGIDENAGKSRAFETTSELIFQPEPLLEAEIRLCMAEISQGEQEILKDDLRLFDKNLTSYRIRSEFMNDVVEERIVKSDGSALMGKQPWVDVRDEKKDENNDNQGR